MYAEMLITEQDATKRAAQGKAAQNGSASNGAPSNGSASNSDLSNGVGHDDAAQAKAARETFLQDVLAGLTAEPKTLPCKYLYDQRGSELFEAICEVEEYYVTRADLEATRTHVEEIAALLGPDVLLVELGSGSSTKTRTLLDHLVTPSAYVPIDISPEVLHASAEALRQRYPQLEVLPLAADYSQRLTLPKPARPSSKTVIYFPGSTIGNFGPTEAAAFMRRLHDACLPEGMVLIGVDLKKDKAVLEAAYDDAAGVTAAFNLNLLTRINKELGANFEMSAFAHRAIYNDTLGRIEMHLVSQRQQTVTLGGTSFTLRAGETIRSEESYKYSLEEFAAVSQQAGLSVERVWTDARGYFSLQLLVPIAK